MFPYSRGKCLCWDSTCVDAFCSKSVADTAVTAGAAATRAERRKRERYSGLTDRYLFEPVAVETAGTCGTSTLMFLKSLGTRISSQTGDKRETRWMFERNSLAVTRGNADSVLANETVHG